MTKNARRWPALAGGIAVAAISGFMIVDQVGRIRRAPADAARLTELEARVKEDADVAPELDAERERQTARSVARQARNHRLGYGLIAAAAVFLSAANWRRASSSPSLCAGAAGGRPDALVSISPSRASAADELDLAFVDAVIAREGRGREAAIPILQALQAHYRYLPEEALHRVCQETDVTAAQIAGVAGFYAQFRRTPSGRHLVRVCHGTACHVAGIGPVMDEMRRRLGIPDGDDTDLGRRFTLDPVACLGCCSLAPVMMVGDDVAAHLTPMTACAALAAAETRPAGEARQEDAA